MGLENPFFGPLFSPCRAFKQVSIEEGGGGASMRPSTEAAAAPSPPLSPLPPLADPDATSRFTAGVDAGGFSFEMFEPRAAGVEGAFFFCTGKDAAAAAAGGGGTAVPSLVTVLVGVAIVWGVRGDGDASLSREIRAPTMPEERREGVKKVLVLLLAVLSSTMIFYAF